MAKAYLLRYGSDADFTAIKLQLRELGVAVDSEKLYLGLEDRNILIPNKEQVEGLINTAVPLYKHKTGTVAELATSQTVDSIAYATDTKRLIFKHALGSKLIATSEDLMLSDPIAVVVEAANIDAGDDNSVSLSGFSRPSRTVFKNGVLCTNNANDSHRYSFDAATKILKIYGCQENDIIAYL